MTSDTIQRLARERAIQRLARERAIQRLSPSQANLLTRPIRAGELDDTDRVANIVQDMQAGFVLAEMTLDEARSFRPSGADSLAGIRGRETADAEADHD